MEFAKLPHFAVGDRALKNQVLIAIDRLRRKQRGETLPPAAFKVILLGFDDQLSLTNYLTIA